MSAIYIGTSGYSYSYWKGRFYPEKLRASEWLSYYSILFNSLELNNTFYRFPVKKNLKKAAEATPVDFRFSVKAHKIITHSLRMKNAKQKISEFTDIVMEAIDEKLACILFQLPPSYSYSEERLNDILESIEHLSRNVIEFRHSSWWNNEVYRSLQSCNLSFCSVSFPNLPEDDIRTSSLFYKRMHGVPVLFESAYSEKEIVSLADSIPVKYFSFIYFNNTTYGAGYSNASYLTELVRRNRELL